MSGFGPTNKRLLAPGWLSLFWELPLCVPRGIHSEDAVGVALWPQQAEKFD